MSPTLQRLISELNQLTLEEKWKLLGYLMNQLQSSVCLVASPKPEHLSVGVLNIDSLIEETSGSWGRQSLEEIDAELNRQRQIDWGE